MAKHRSLHLGPGRSPLPWLRSLALAAAALLVPAAASAQNPPLPDPAEEWYAEPSDLDESAWDVPNTIIVDAKDSLDASSLASLAARAGLSFRPTDLEAKTKIELADVLPSDMADVLRQLREDPDVERAEPLARVRAFYSVNDPLLAEQWHLERIGSPRAWDFATGRGVTVAVVDTGIACEDHGPYTKGTDLAQTDCVGGWNFVTNNEHANDDQGHGTHVAGTIAQSTNNGIGAAGVAFHASLMPVKVLNESGWGTTADVADGIRWAAEHGAHVVNLSLGGPRNSSVLEDAVKYALSQGTVVVAAAGNTGGRVQYPGATDGVIGVSATDSDDKLAKFSSRGDGVDVAAPGVNVVQQTVCNKGRDKCERFPGFSGTSMASPHVAGVAALMVGLGITDPAAVEGAIRASARVVDESDGGKKLYGAGILDAAAATQRVTLVHALFRLFALLGIAAAVWASARRLSAKSVSPWRGSFMIPALAAGPGLLFFLPWVLPRVHLAVDLLARPIADFDFLIGGASLHRWLPLANAIVPFGLTMLLYGLRAARPVVAGFAVGTAAYLASQVGLAEGFGPFGKVALMVWCGANALLCAWIARTNLTADDSASSMGRDGSSPSTSQPD